jgi:hypothetical protein
VDVRRLAPVQRNEEEPIGAPSENRWHGPLIVCLISTTCAKECGGGTWAGFDFTRVLG